MSTERGTRHGLAYWVRALVDLCDLDPLGGGARLRAVVGSRRARIALDDDVVEVGMRAGELEIVPPRPELPVDGTGACTTPVVLAILDGELEVSTALRTGLIEATGSRAAVARIFHAIEILLDASSRVPELRRLADEFRHEAGNAHVRGLTDDRAVRREEHALLGRLGLIGER